MKVLNLILLVLTLILPALSAPQAAADTSENNVAYLEYKTTMYPFMRQNCASCHSEAAVYPQGPLHSSKDPIVGFGVFAKLIDWKKPAEESRVFKVGSNMHYCKDYSTNCDKVNVIVPELQRRLRLYVLNVQQKVAAQSAAGVTPGNSDPAAGTPEYNAKALALESKSWDFPAPTERDHHYLKAHLQTPEGGLNLLATAVRINDDYVQITSLSLREGDGYGVGSLNGAFLLEGVKFAVNGQDADAITGWENSSRLAYIGVGSTRLIFNSSVDGVPDYLPGFVTFFPLRTGLLAAKEGDTITLKIGKFSKLDAYPSVACAGKSADEISAGLLNPLRINLRSDESASETSMQYCLNLESNFDSRSIVKSQLMTNGYFTSTGMAPDVITALRKFFGR